MPNSIALAQAYLPILDGVYKKESRTAILDTNSAQVQFIAANVVKLYKMSLDGLGTYARNTGFVAGSETGTWETLTLAQDRGRTFSIDSMDDEETLAMAFGSLGSEFIRTMVTPELDAYRFAKYTAGAGNVASADLSGVTDFVGLIDTAEQVMGDADVPTEGRILFVSEAMYKGIKGNITRMFTNEGEISREVEMLNNMIVIRVPQNRFNSAITLYDGTTSGEEAGGYIVPASTSYALNFMIVEPSAVVQVVKHVMPRVFSPDVNQTADAWKFDYRIYHDAFVEQNKVDGIYVHKAATANS